MPGIDTHQFKIYKHFCFCVQSLFALVLHVIVFILFGHIVLERTVHADVCLNLDASKSSMCTRQTHKSTHAHTAYAK